MTQHDSAIGVLCHVSDPFRNKVTALDLIQYLDLYVKANMCENEGKARKFVRAESGICVPMETRFWTCYIRRLCVILWTSQCCSAELQGPDQGFHQ